MLKKKKTKFRKEVHNTSSQIVVDCPTQLILYLYLSVPWQIWKNTAGKSASQIGNLGTSFILKEQASFSSSCAAIITLASTLEADCSIDWSRYVMNLRTSLTAGKLSLLSLVGFKKMVLSTIGHNALSSSNPLEVGQCLILPKLNFVNDCNGVSYGGWQMCPPLFCVWAPLNKLCPWSLLLLLYFSNMANCISLKFLTVLLATWLHYFLN